MKRLNARFNVLRCSFESFLFVALALHCSLASKIHSPKGREARNCRNGSHTHQGIPLANGSHAMNPIPTRNQCPSIARIPYPHECRWPTDPMPTSRDEPTSRNPNPSYMHNPIPTNAIGNGSHVPDACRERGCGHRIRGNRWPTGSLCMGSVWVWGGSEALLAARSAAARGVQGRRAP